MIGERIRAAREAKGMTTVQLAAAVGVSQSAVSNWETGAGRAPSRDNAVKVARVLGITVDELLADAPAQPEVAATEPTAEVPAQ